MKARKKRLLILADDLTGALDTGVQFAKNGTSVEVYLTNNFFLDEHKHKGGTGEAAVTVVNTCSRHLTVDEAGAAVKAALQASGASGAFSFFYKKTDSCLRGNIGAELEALMTATGIPRLPFVPAFPAMKRTTRNGFQYIEGIPIHESPMARDPLNPIHESFIPAIIGAESAIPARLVPAGAEVPVPKGGREILVFDGSTEADLQQSAETLFRGDLLTAAAGCAGFAEALMRVLPLEKNERETPPTISRLPILVVSGSLHPASVNQVKAALADGADGFSVDGENLTAGWEDSAEAEKLAASSARALAEKGLAVLGTDSAFGKTRARGKGDNSAADRIPAVLGALVKKITDRTPLHLVVFGGDTLLGIADALQYNRLWPRGEIRPGVVLTEARAENRGALLVTKAGAFGETGLVSVITEFFNRGR